MLIGFDDITAHTAVVGFEAAAEELKRMNATLTEHHAQHLHPVYAWMIDGIDAELARSEGELQGLDLPTHPGGTAAISELALDCTHCHGHAVALP
jgi:hypothetical protein